jgi:putative peptidoglycan lipid II flippase
VAGCAGQIVAAGFYARGSTSWPVRVGVVGFSFGAVLKIIGFAWLGVVGVALATSVYYVINPIVLHLIGNHQLRLTARMADRSA